MTEDKKTWVAILLENKPLVWFIAMVLTLTLGYLIYNKYQIEGFGVKVTPPVQTNGNVSINEFNKIVDDCFEEIKKSTNDKVSIDNLSLINQSLNKIINFPQKKADQSIEGAKIKEIEEYLINYTTSDINNCSAISTDLKSMKDCVSDLKLLCDVVLNFMKKNGLNSYTKIRQIESVQLTVSLVKVVRKSITKYFSKFTSDISPIVDVLIPTGATSVQR
jgi:Iap family predicted aminopeptidase